MKHVKHIEINVIAVAIHLLLHDRAGTLASLLYKAEKPSVCLSLRPYASRYNRSGFCMNQLGTWFVHS